MEPTNKRVQSGVYSDFAERRGGSMYVQLSKTDINTVIKYLEDAARLYDALAALPLQRATCRSHMIKQLTQKLKNKLIIHFRI